MIEPIEVNVHRRATSHNSYLHRKRPNIKLHAKRQKGAKDAGEVAECSTSDHVVRTPICSFCSAEQVSQDADEVPLKFPKACAWLLQDPEAEAPKYENRAMRRRRGRLQQQIVQRCSTFNPGAESSTSRRLETHVWHAKRMSMVTRWLSVHPAAHLVLLLAPALACLF